jgi:hypothetical protein
MSKDIKIGDLIENIRSYHPAADVEVIRGRKGHQVSLISFIRSR